MASIALDLLAIRTRGRFVFDESALQSEEVLVNVQFLVKRTRTGNAPAELSFGELAFSDGDDRLHIGKADESIASGHLVPVFPLQIGDTSGLQAEIDSLKARISALEASN